MIRHIRYHLTRLLFVSLICVTRQSHMNLEYLDKHAEWNEELHIIFLLDKRLINALNVSHNLVRLDLV